MGVDERFWAGAGTGSSGKASKSFDQPMSNQRESELESSCNVRDHRVQHSTAIFLINIIITIHRITINL